MIYPRDVANVLRDIAQALATGRQPEDVQAERHARERHNAELPPAVTHRGGVTITVHRDRVPHQPDDDCVNHCYSHHLDETGAAYLWCGECFHAFPTRWALHRDHIRDHARVYWQDLRHPQRWSSPTVTTGPISYPPLPDGNPFATVINLPAVPDTFWARHPRLDTLRHLARLPFTRTRNITFCPHCIHDLV